MVRSSRSLYCYTVALLLRNFCMSTTCMFFFWSITSWTHGAIVAIATIPTSVSATTALIGWWQQLHGVMWFVTYLLKLLISALFLQTTACGSSHYRKRVNRIVLLVFWRRNISYCVPCKLSHMRVIQCVQKKTKILNSSHCEIKLPCVLCPIHTADAMRRRRRCVLGFRWIKLVVSVIVFS